MRIDSLISTFFFRKCIWKKSEIPSEFHTIWICQARSELALSANVISWQKMTESKPPSPDENPACRDPVRAIQAHWRLCLYLMTYWQLRSYGDGLGAWLKVSSDRLVTPGGGGRFANRYTLWFILDPCPPLDPRNYHEFYLTTVIFFVAVYFHLSSCTHYIDACFTLI